MHRDTDFTLREISEEFTFPESIATQEAPSGPLENLRFIVVPQIAPVDGLLSGFTCSVTSKGEYPGTKDYVAVSYCWDSFGASNAAAKMDPKVMVDDGGHLRALRCPFEVLHRAIRYALWREAKLLWIDQECIDQTDLADVQEHLRYMHLIFEQAEYSIGLLSYEISSWTQYRALSILVSDREEFERGSAHLYDLDLINYLTRFLKSISRDSWFSRAWAYQEKFSAEHSMHLLLPWSSDFYSAIPLELDFPFDFPLDCGKLLTGLVFWSMFLRDALSQDLITGQVFEEIERALRCLFESVRLVGVTFASSDWEVAIRSFPKEEGAPLLEEHSSHGFRLCENFRRLEQCDNRVVSDRVAIFANLAHFEHRLRTTDLPSYSMSLLTLLAFNNNLPRILIRTQTEEEEIYGFSHDVSIGIVLDEIMWINENLHGPEELLKKELLEDSKVLTGLIKPHLPPGASAESIINIAKAGGHLDCYRSLLDKNLERVKSVVFLSGSATICEVFEGISYFDRASAEVNPALGRQIVQFGIQTGQVPPSVEFLAFASRWRWQRSFIEDHFVDGGNISKQIHF